MTGRLRIKIGAEEHILNKEDSIYFDSTVQHSYSNASRSACTGDRGDDTVEKASNTCQHF